MKIASANNPLKQNLPSSGVVNNVGFQGPANVLYVPWKLLLHIINCKLCSIVWFRVEQCTCCQCEYIKKPLFKKSFSWKPMKIVGKWIGCSKDSKKQHLIMFLIMASSTASHLGLKHFPHCVYTERYFGQNCYFAAL